MEDIWLAWAKRLQAIASTGSHFGGTVFDKERYAEIAEIANAMLATLGNVPLSRIESLVSDFAQGYATPKVDVRGAVILGDQIMLVQEKSDGLWTLPGGYAEVGLSPGDNVVKEIREEANIEVVPLALYGIRHKARHRYDADPRDFYKLFYLCQKVDEAQPSAGIETIAAQFFARNALPPLSTGRVIQEDISGAFEFLANPQRLAFFD